MRISTAFSALAAMAAFASGAAAADWQSVATVNGERVEIDKARVMRTGPSVNVAWTRLVLGRELNDAGGAYTSVQAMNRYDCGNHTFATLRRIYMNGEQAVREEKVGSPKEVSAAGGTVEGKLLAEACKPRTVGDAHRIAEAAAKAAEEAQPGRPGMMTADVRRAGEEPTTRTVQVADGDRPASAADTKIEVRPSSERPRFIDLPKRERQQAPADAEQKATEISAPEVKTVESKAPPAKAPEARPVARPVEKAPVAVANITRNDRERQLATSGPRRAAAPRPVTIVEYVPHTAEPHHDVHWAYEGDGAPANWAKLKPEYALCATGQRQSPIDIREGIRVDLEPIKFDYKTSYFRIIDNGHTVQVNVGEGSTMTVMGRTYQLQQFHFHRPSEERVNGKAYDMVAHLVHRDDEGKLAVVSVLLEKGAENPLIQTLWNNMPLEVNQDVAPAVAIDLNALLPENRAYYTYMGSLTTPPCTEDVLWMVFKQPMPVSADQVAIFSRLYRNNARPVQPSNNRLVKENR